MWDLGAGGRVGGCGRTSMNPPSVRMQCASPGKRVRGLWAAIGLPSMRMFRWILGMRTNTGSHVAVFVWQPASSQFRLAPAGTLAA